MNASTTLWLQRLFAFLLAAVTLALVFSGVSFAAASSGDHEAQGTPVAIQLPPDAPRREAQS